MLSGFVVAAYGQEFEHRIVTPEPTGAWFIQRDGSTILQGGPGATTVTLPVGVYLLRAPGAGIYRGSRLRAWDLIDDNYTLHVGLAETDVRGRDPNYHILFSVSYSPYLTCFEGGGTVSATLESVEGTQSIPYLYPYYDEAEASLLPGIDYGYSYSLSAYMNPCDPVPPPPTPTPTPVWPPEGPAPTPALPCSGGQISLARPAGIPAGTAADLAATGAGSAEDTNTDISLSGYVIGSANAEIVLDGEQLPDFGDHFYLANSSTGGSQYSNSDSMTLSGPPLRSLDEEDNTTPVLVSFACRDDRTAFHEDAIDFLLRYSEPVLGVDASMFDARVVSGDVAITGFTLKGNGSVYVGTIEISPTGQGQIDVNYHSNGQVTDLSFNPTATTETASLPALTVDRIPPTILGFDQVDPSEPGIVSRVRFRIHSSEPLADDGSQGSYLEGNHDFSDLSVAFEEESPGVYLATVTSAKGSIGDCEFHLATRPRDLAQNPSVSTYSSPSYTFRNHLPTASLEADPVNPPNGSEFSFSLLASEPLSSFDSTAFRVTGPLADSVSGTSVYQTGRYGEYRIYATVDGVVSGYFGVETREGAITDLTGNALPVTSSTLVLVDRRGPVFQLCASPVDRSTSHTARFTLEADEPFHGCDLSHVVLYGTLAPFPIDLTISGSGTAREIRAAVANLPDGGGTLYIGVRTYDLTDAYGQGSPQDMVISPVVLLPEIDSSTNGLIVR